MGRFVNASLMVVLSAATFLSACGRETEQAEVNIYSYRQDVLIRPLLDAFTAQTGIAVNVVSGKADALLERLKNEGINTPADVLLTADVGRLVRAKEAGVLQPHGSAVINATVPAAYRDPDGYWVGLSLRARTIFYAKDWVDPARLSTLAALADDLWKGEICVRSSTNIYNQSMVAAMIGRLGIEAAERWAAGVVANMARTPQGGDRDQIRAVAAGECDLAIGNSYYYGRMLAAEPGTPDREAAEKVGIFWSDQDQADGTAGYGTHVNISGAGVTAHARNRAHAVALIEFLLSEAAQKIYAESVYEFPVRAGVPLSPIVESWGAFKADDANLAGYAANSRDAVKIFDRVGWP